MPKSTDTCRQPTGLGRHNVRAACDIVCDESVVFTRQSTLPTVLSRSPSNGSIKPTMHWSVTNISWQMLRLKVGALGAQLPRHLQAAAPFPWVATLVSHILLNSLTQRHSVRCHLRSMILEQWLNYVDDAPKRYQDFLAYALASWVNSGACASDIISSSESFAASIENPVRSTLSLQTASSVVSNGSSEDTHSGKLLHDFSHEASCGTAAQDAPKNIAAAHLSSKDHSSDPRLLWHELELHIAIKALSEMRLDGDRACGGAQ